MDSDRIDDHTNTVIVAGDPDLSGALRDVGDRLEVVEHVATGTEAIARVLAELPDLLLLDVHLEEPDARAVCRRIRDWAPATRVVAATANDDERAYTTLVAGATAAVRLTDDAETVARTLRSVARGESILLARMANRLIHDLDAWAQRSADPLHPPPTLTATEREVLSSVGQGVTVEAIAEAHAVTTHLVNLHAGFAVGKLHRYVLGNERIAAEG
jgi:DNA-binding NarL/FixJ family response regulator